MTASFYKTVYQRKFNEMPRWKKLAIVEDSEKNNWSGLLTDFIKSVIEEAEKDFANFKSTVVSPSGQYETVTKMSSDSFKKKN
jgi:hypothetical protein